MNYVFLDYQDVPVICVLMYFFLFPGSKKACLFLMVYKLINGIYLVLFIGASKCEPWNG